MDQLEQAMLNSLADRIAELEHVVAALSQISFMGAASLGDKLPGLIRTVAEADSPLPERTRGILRLMADQVERS